MCEFLILGHKKNEAWLLSVHRVVAHTLFTPDTVFPQAACSVFKDISDYHCVFLRTLEVAQVLGPGAIVGRHDRVQSRRIRGFHNTSTHGDTTHC